MKIGELVETIIRIRDEVSCWENKDALADACNILDELPSSFNVEDAREFIRQAREKEDK